MIKGYITIKKAAEILGVAVETLRSWDKTGRLKALRNKANRYRLYKISDLEKFAERTGLRRKSRSRFKLTKEN